ncbi:MAG: Rieske 2Fe-2S domain-containing protein [Dehalococcoidia bacterium]|nr:Rieske 2Fe-2S domain-containing protein [Dehalococcoidia bacterium]
MAGIAGIIKSIFGICETKPLSPGLWSLESGKVRVKVGQIHELSEKGGTVYLSGQGLSKPILIVRTEGEGYLVFADRCTHFGRKLDPVPGEPLLRCCSINHSKYDYEGKKISGPGKRPLTRYSAELVEGDLLVAL